MKVRKIAAIAVGAAMIGATMGYASAQLNVPKDFFVKDGAPNVKIVVGSNAAAMDVASAADIAVALGSMLYTAEEVQADGVSVIVKKDVTTDPDDLTIYKYYYETAGTIKATDWEDLEDYEDYWWNGSAYNGSYDEWKTAYSSDPWKTEIENMDEYEGDKQIDWDLTIKEISLEPTDPDDWDEADIVQPPKAAKLKIPEGAFEILVNFTIGNWTVEVDLGKDDQWGIPDSETFTVIDDDAPNAADIADEYDVDPSDVTITPEDPVYEGIEEESTFTLLGNSYYVLDIGSDSFKYGKDHGEKWFHVGEEMEFDGYKVQVLDISINENRALVKVTAPDGESDLVILDDENPEKDVFDDGGIILTLENTFVGIDGNLIAQVTIQTNVKTIESGDELLDGWDAYFEIGTNADGDPVIKWITLKNSEDIEASTVDVLGKYKVYYKFQGYTEDEDDVDYDINDDGDKKDELYTAEAKIVIEPTEKVYDTKELKVGDELEGWTIDEIKGDTYTKITVKPPAEPITVLDSEVDLNNVDSNLILVGGPVANSVTAYLVDQGVSTIDWYNSDGDIEYLEDAFGDYDVLIVAGKNREATKAAAEELMAYLKDLA